MTKMSENKNSLLYWYPRISDLGIPTPKTKIVKLTDKEIEGYYRCEGDCFNLDRLVGEVGKIIKADFKLPVFLRTDEFSNKHFWKKSCYLDNLDNLKSNLFEIICGSRLADILGLNIEAIVVREFIPMDTKFYACHCEMPINPERRYFIKNNNVQCHHPYLIEDAVEKGTPPNKLPENWKGLAKQINFESDDEISLLTDYSQKVANVFDDYFSVDYCKASDGRWILIDMAEGEKSWHPSECKYSNMPEEKPVEKSDFSFLIEKKD